MIKTKLGIEKLSLKNLSHLGYTKTPAGYKIEALTTKKVSYVEIVDSEDDAIDIIQQIVKNT